MTERTPESEPICEVCGKRIPMGEGRFRPGDVSIHVECYERWKKGRPTVHRRRVVDSANLVLGTKLTQQEKADLVTFLRQL
jgi:hypothetical protein